MKVELNEISVANSAKFIELFIDTLDSSCHGVQLTEDLTANYSKIIQSENEELTREPLFGFDPNARTLYLK